MTNDALTFSRPVHVHEVPATGRHFNIATSESEREAVARQLGLPGIAELSARLVVSPFRKDGLAVAGTVHARLTQTCVVSAEDFENTVEAPVEIRFSPDGQDPNADFDLAELNDPDAEDPPDLLTGGEIDLGAIIAEFLALALDPYPRKPGISFEGPAEDADLSPFAALNALKNKDQ
ncbi:phosphodiesterase [Labrys miyagiensis]